LIQISSNFTYFAP